MDIIVDGATLILRGELDARSTDKVRSAIYRHLVSHDSVVIDLTGVDHADVISLKVIAAASRRAFRTGHRIVVRGACPAVRRILHLSHLIRFVELEREPVAV